MSSYWMSDDMTVTVKTFEGYLIDALREGKMDHAIRAQFDNVGNVQFYIHPLNADGETIDYKVVDNSIWPAHKAFEKPNERLIMFLTHDSGRMFTADAMTWYINALDKLRNAVEVKNAEEVVNILTDIHEHEAEFGL